MTTPLPNPAPYKSPDNAEFWAAAAAGRLLLRRCDACSFVIWYPRPFCPACGSLKTSWMEASGRGIVYTFTTVYRSMASGFREAVPYVIAYVQLAEGPRVLTNIVEVDPAEVQIGMPVSVVFADTGDDSALYRFAPALQAGA